MRQIHFDTIDSTSTFARGLVADRDLTEPVLITAEQQTAGRGRTGKTFYSERGNGLYMTVAFQVDRRPQDSLFVTVAAAVAVCEVLREAGCLNAEIKWVNDIYVSDRKVGGILTEAVTDPETGIMRCVLVGIGLNIDADMDRFPEELKDRAGTLRRLRMSKETLARKLAEHMIKRVTGVFSRESIRNEVLGKYREHSMIIGREVCWEENGAEKTGVAIDIDDNANLIVSTDDGEEKLDSGYVSILFR